MNTNDFTFIPLTTELNISEIITIHYFEYMSDFLFSGESHDFWEFLCVDKGEVDVIGGETSHSLKKGDIIFHKPNEFHNVFANGKIAPNLVVITFRCTSPCMRFFENKILHVTETDRTLIAQIIQESRLCFQSPLDDPYLTQMQFRSQKNFASLQLIKIYLEQLLIMMIRRGTQAEHTKPLIKSIKKKNDAILYEHIRSYLEQHVRSHVTIEMICHDNLIGRSQLQKLFRERHECGVIDYFSRLKINSAKVLIREKNMNFSQISDYLGYTSIHYFSRQFKKTTGMTPSEYASSIKLLSEIPFLTL